MPRLLAQRTLVVLLLCVACGGGPPPTAAPTATPAHRTASLPSERRADSTSQYSTVVPPPVTPTSCTDASVARVLDGFIAAFNAGDQAQLDQIFGPQFVWYAVTEGDVQNGGRGFIAYGPKENGAVVVPPPAGSNITVGTRADLLPYFAARHAHREQLALRSFGGKYEALRNIYNFTYRLSRVADDLTPDLAGTDGIAHGKGAIRCADATVIVWTMSQGSPDP